MNAKILFGILTGIVVLAMNAFSQIQVYELSAPLNGAMSMTAQDVNAPTTSSSSGFFSGGFELEFNSLSETIYLDPVGGTLRQVGTILYIPTATNIQFEDIQIVPGESTNPPTEVSGIVTVTLAPSGGSLSFDTGPQPVTWDPAEGVYTLDGYIWTSGLPMSGSYSLVTGGQTLTGTFSYILAAPWYGVPPYMFSTLTFTDYPSTIQLGGLADFNFMILQQPDIVAEVAATNGFIMKLDPGIVTMPHTGGWPGESFDWNVPGAPTATNLTSEVPTIIDQPQSVVVNAYGTATFSVAAAGAIPLAYQWSSNGTEIAQATSTTLTITNVTQNALGTYSVVVTNAFGVSISSNAVLCLYPYIASPFTGAVAYLGTDATLGVDAWGTGPLDYQWIDDDNVIAGATNQTLTLTNIQATNAGLYSVVVSSPFGSATNAPAQLIVEPAGISLGRFPGVIIQGAVGRNYIIQSTTNLSDSNSWVTLTNLTLTQPVQIWMDANTDTSLPGNPLKFYQVSLGQ
jgi:hypothetical protein